MGPRVPFVSNPFGAISPNNVVETETGTETLTHVSHNQQLSPSQDYTNQDDQPTTNIDPPGSQPTTVLLRITPTRTINQPQTVTLLGHNQQPSPSQDYTNQDDQPTTNI